MKKLGIVLAILLGIGGFLFLNKDVVVAKTNSLIYQSPCETTRYYSIGRTDSEFNLSADEFAQAVNEAADVWNTAYGKKLFVYDADAPLTVNLIYDNRQSLNTEIGELNEEVKEEDSVLKPRIEEYNRKSADLKRRIDALNQEINSWNEKGGAPADVYERLKNDQRSLNNEVQELNAEADRLSISTKDINSKIDHLNDTVTTFNDALQVKPEGGKYILDENGERIVINIYDSRQELVNVLAHEIGHALGMNHVNNPQAIMYAESNDSISLTAEDIVQLRYACRKQNVLRAKVRQVSYTVQQVMQRFIPVSRQ